MTVVAPAGTEYEFLQMDKVRMGPGCVAGVGDEVDRLGGTRVLIVTGQSLANGTRLVERVADLFGDRCVGVFSGTQQHVPYASVLAALTVARDAAPDLIVGIGGSSATDTAKLVALGLARSVVTEADLHRCRRVGRDGDVPAFDENLPLIPNIAIPTTLSAGEFTSAAGATDTSSSVKHPFRAPSMVPRVVFLDPEFTAATPMQLWGSTGIRALHHAIATVCSPVPQPFADALAVAAISILGESLVPGASDPNDVVNRGRCQIAAWMSVTSMSSVPFGLGHRLGHYLGARCGVPHGVASCICLPAMMRHDRGVHVDRQAVVATALGIRPESLTPAEIAGEGEQRVRDIIAALGISRRLRDWGVTEADLPLIAAALGTEADSGTFDAQGIHELLQELY